MPKSILQTPKRDCCKRVARAHIAAMAEQVQADHIAANVLVMRLGILQAAARDTLKLVEAARTNTWTPADDLLLAEIRALVK